MCDAGSGADETGSFSVWGALAVAASCVSAVFACMLSGSAWAAAVLGSWGTGPVLGSDGCSGVEAILGSGGSVDGTSVAEAAEGLGSGMDRVAWADDDVGSDDEDAAG